MASSSRYLIIKGMSTGIREMAFYSHPEMAFFFPIKRVSPQAAVICFTTNLIRVNKRLIIEAPVERRQKRTT